MQMFIVENATAIPCPRILYVLSVVGIAQYEENPCCTSSRRSLSRLLHQHCLKGGLAMPARFEETGTTVADLEAGCSLCLSVGLNLACQWHSKICRMLEY